jgi:hypothetical protein
VIENNSLPGCESDIAVNVTTPATRSRDKTRKIGKDHQHQTKGNQKDANTVVKVNTGAKKVKVNTKATKVKVNTRATKVQVNTGASKVQVNTRASKPRLSLKNSRTCTHRRIITGKSRTQNITDNSGTCRKSSRSKTLARSRPSTHTEMVPVKVETSQIVSDHELPKKRCRKLPGHYEGFVMECTAGSKNNRSVGGAGLEQSDSLVVDKLSRKAKNLKVSPKNFFEKVTTIYQKVDIASVPKQDENNSLEERTDVKCTNQTMKVECEISANRRRGRPRKNIKPNPSAKLDKREHHSDRNLSRGHLLQKQKLLIKNRVQKEEPHNIDNVLKNKRDLQQKKNLEHVTVKKVSEERIKFNKKATESETLGKLVEEESNTQEQQNECQTLANTKKQEGEILDETNDMEFEIHVIQDKLNNRDNMTSKKKQKHLNDERENAETCSRYMVEISQILEKGNKSPVTEELLPTDEGSLKSNKHTVGQCSGSETFVPLCSTKSSVDGLDATAQKGYVTFQVKLDAKEMQIITKSQEKLPIKNKPKTLNFVIKNNVVSSELVPDENSSHDLDEVERRSVSKQHADNHKNHSRSNSGHGDKETHTVSKSLPSLVCPKCGKTLCSAASLKSK